MGCDVGPTHAEDFGRLVRAERFSGTLQPDERTVDERRLTRADVWDVFKARARPTPWASFSGRGG
jgi:hypothetical protein